MEETTHPMELAHTEDGRFEIRINLEAHFHEGYEGEMDEYAWKRHFDEVIRRDLLTAVAETLRRHPGWELIPTSSGYDPRRVAEFVYRYRADSESPRGG